MSRSMINLSSIIPDRLKQVRTAFFFFIKIVLFKLLRNCKRRKKINNMKFLRAFIKI